MPRDRPSRAGRGLDSSSWAMPPGWARSGMAQRTVGVSTESTAVPTRRRRPSQVLLHEGRAVDVEQQVGAEAAHVPVEVGAGGGAAGQGGGGDQVHGGEVEERARRRGDVEQLGVVVGRVEGHLVAELLAGPRRWPGGPVGRARPRARRRPRGRRGRAPVPSGRVMARRWPTASSSAAVRLADRRWPAPSTSIRPWVRSPTTPVGSTSRSLDRRGPGATSPGTASTRPPCRRRPRRGAAIGSCATGHG